MKKTKQIVAFVLSMLMLVTILPSGMGEAVQAATVSQSSVKSSHTPLPTSKYYQYSKLNSTQKKAYNAIVKGIASYTNKVNIASYKIKKADVSVLIQKVLADHPEFFYVSKQYSFVLDSTKKLVRDVLFLYYDGKKTDTLTKDYKPVVKANRKTIASQIAAVKKKAATVTAKISPKWTQLEKEKYIHDYLTSNINYNYVAAQNSAKAAPHVFTVYGALINKSAVCEGYSYSFVYLCHLVGINATVITGYDKNGGNHMWNAVQINKSWYLTDITWDDIDAKDLPTTYQYFNITSLEMNQDHTVVTKLSCPSCTATKNSHKSLFMNLENNKLPANYKTVIDSAYKNKETSIPLYKGKDGVLSTSVISNLFFGSNSAVRKYIWSKGYGMTFSQSVLQYGNYAFIKVSYSAKTQHSYKTTITPATLSKDGSIVKKCTICGGVASKTAIKRVKTYTLSATAYTYDGKAKTPSVTVKDSAGKTLKKNTDYTVSYASGRKNVGTYKVTIKLKGNYKGTVVLTFKIIPSKTTVSKLTPASKALKVTVGKKTTQVTGYQIQYSTSKSFKTYSTKWLTKNTATSANLTGLKTKTTYYVRVRTYKTIGSTKYYSGWSTIKYAKTK